MTLNIRISIDDGKGKKAELEINEADNLSKLVIIQNVFSLFGIDNDVLEMSQTYSKIGAAYESFFKEVDPVEFDQILQNSNNHNNIKEQLISGFTENQEVLATTYKNTDDLTPAYYITGIKTDPTGKKRYRLHYRCTECNYKGTHYVHENSKRTWCHECHYEMAVYDANPLGFPHSDSRQNFFRAGDYRDRNLDWERN